MKADIVAKIEAALAGRFGSSTSKLLDLERHGSRIAIVVVVHAVNDAGEVRQDRFIGSMSDSASWADFLEHVTDCTHLDTSVVRDLKFTYFDHTDGSLVLLKDQTALRHWLDEHWLHYPLEVHAHHTEVLSRPAEQAKLVKEAFSKYDTDGNGFLSMEEMSQMLGELCAGLEINEREVAVWSRHEFEKADENSDGVISFEEFEKYFANLQEHLQKELAKDSYGAVMRSRYDELAGEARSYRIPLAKAFERKTLRLDAHGHVHGIELAFDAEAAKAHFEAKGEELNSARWVRAQTLLESKVSHFADGSDGQIEFHRGSRSAHERTTLLVTSIVQVEFETLHGAARYDQPPPYKLTVPHCLEPSQLTAADLVVMRCEDPSSARWAEMSPSEFEVGVSPPMASDGASAGTTDGSGFVRLQLSRGGIFAVFARKDAIGLKQRVQCLVILPERILPVHEGQLRVRVVPCLPAEIDKVLREEQAAHGHVRIAGKSEVMAIDLPKSILQVSVELKRPVSQSILWVGSRSKCDFAFHTSELALDDGASAGDEAASNATAAQMRQRGTVRLGLTSQPMGGGAGKVVEQTLSMEVSVVIHKFPPPSAPTNLRCEARTNLYLNMQWDLPIKWGGCSLRKFELQVKDEGIRSRAQDKKPSTKRMPSTTARVGPAPPPAASASTSAAAEDAASAEVDNVGKWRTIYDGLPENLERPEARLFFGIYAGKFRVRAYNEACPTPSEWSDVFTLGTVTEELEKKVVAVAQAGMIRKTTFVKRAKQRQAEREQEQSQTGAVADAGVAIVNHASLSSKSLKDVAHSSMSGWSPFATDLGQLFLELGVAGGVRGHLFDLRIEQIEALSTEQELTVDSQGLDHSKPLIVLASTGCWVMQTLAHHTEVCDKEGDWIKLMADVEGLVALAAHHRVPFDESFRPHVLGLVRVLLELFETMRQCEHDGFIACTLLKSKELALPKNASRRAGLVAAYNARLVTLHKKTATYVMAIMLQDLSSGLARGLPLALDAEAASAVHVAQVAVEGVPNGGSAEASMRFQLTDDQGQRLAAGQTCACGSEEVVGSLVDPSWTDELVSLEAGDALSPDTARPLRLVIELWVSEHPIATATVSLLHAFGFVRGLHLGLVGGGPVKAAAARELKASFAFRVPAWVAADLAQRADGSHAAWSAV